MSTGRCSPETAAKIASIFLDFAGETGDLARHLGTRKRSAASPEPVLPPIAGEDALVPAGTPHHRRYGRGRKVSTAMEELILSLRGNSVSFVLEQIYQTFGVEISPGPVYSTWNRGSPRESKANK